jgi:hypothetical protein
MRRFRGQSDYLMKSQEYHRFSPLRGAGAVSRLKADGSRAVKSVGIGIAIGIGIGFSLSLGFSAPRSCVKSRYR